ncbi:MAG TPA: YdcF family protein, partial [Bacteroidia bacterium]|nr:YdcF family protein [Bacteroidia bacterium]
EAAILKDYLVKTGIPDSCIITENQSRNTRENAVLTKKLLDSLHVKGQILFVTSAFHLRRAMGCFEKAGITQLVPCPTDRYSGPRKFEIDFLLLPNSDALEQWGLLIHEITGYMVYKIKGFC